MQSLSLFFFLLFPLQVCALSKRSMILQQSDMFNDIPGPGSIGAASALASSTGALGVHHHRSNTAASSAALIGGSNTGLMVSATKTISNNNNIIIANAGLSYEDVLNDDFQFNMDGHDVMVFLHIQKTGGTSFGRHLVRDLDLKVS